MMQDRFRFRFFDKISKEMCYPTEYNGKAEYLERRYDLADMFRFKDLIPMQCTGMKATNGQFLYEGDIVKFFSCSIIDAMSERRPMTERIGQIVWNEEEMKFDVMVNGEAIPNLCKKTDDNNFELIGNIYENPELLEEKK